MKTAIAAWAAMIAGALFGATRIVATESGADATGATDATAAIQRCLDKVAQAGGGTVYLPPKNVGTDPAWFTHKYYSFWTMRNKF